MAETPSEFSGIVQLKFTEVLFKICTIAFPGGLGSKNKKENKTQIDYLTDN